MNTPEQIAALLYNPPGREVTYKNTGPIITPTCPVCGGPATGTPGPLHFDGEEVYVCGPCTRHCEDHGTPQPKKPAPEPPPAPPETTVSTRPSGLLVVETR